MLNQTVLVGRINEIKELGDTVEIKISVARSYKNEDGEYESDIVPITLKRTNSKEYIRILQRGIFSWY